MLGKWNFAVILSDKWVVENKFSTLLHYSFWRNGQGNSSIILNCEWLSKSPHYQRPKVTFKLFLADFFMTVQHSIIGKRINRVSWHKLMTSTQVISPFFVIFGKMLFFFVFHVTLSFLKRRKWNLTVILTL